MDSFKKQQQAEYQTLANHHEDLKKRSHAEKRNLITEYQVPTPPNPSPLSSQSNNNLTTTAQQSNTSLTAK